MCEAQTTRQGVQVAGRKSGEVRQNSASSRDLGGLIAATSQVDPAFADSAEDAEALLTVLKTIVRIRKGKKLSQAEVAARMGTTQSAISELEKGVVEPRFTTLQRYARILACRLGIEVSEEKLVGSRRHIEIHYNHYFHLISSSYTDRELPYSAILTVSIVATHGSASQGLEGKSPDDVGRRFGQTVARAESALAIESSARQISPLREEIAESYLPAMAGR